MRIVTSSPIATLCLVGAVLFATPGCARDVTGTWATDASKCKDIFRQDRNRFFFREDSDAYGSGFIIEANRIKGKIATCAIKSRKVEGETVHLMMSCATDLMSSNNQFSVKFIDDDTVSRLFPGNSDLQQTYYRCRP